MSQIVVHVENLSKMYRIGVAERQSRNLREAVRSLAVSPFAYLRRMRQPPTEEERFWALRDISLEVQQGEVLGIIGSNGAGKSTLLKILSRITEPTSGRVRINGRVGSLLEVGTGFHPELTGRENIYLNGAILGMKRAEIDRKFAEIVDFAGVEKFLDTPVKRYSSGMYVRLAFSVAAQMEPEVLIVDEVLAVGDAEFQKKCLAKMGEVAKEGRTVLFVSHNMAAIRHLCTSAILLEHGCVRAWGQASEIVRSYLISGVDKKPSVDLENCQQRRGSDAVRFTWVELLDVSIKPAAQYCIGEDIILVFRLKVSPEMQGQRVRLAISIRSSDGIRVAHILDTDSRFQIQALESEETISVTMRDSRLYPDTYYISLWAVSIPGGEIYDYVEDCISFEVLDGGKLTTRSLPAGSGLLFLTPDWSRAEATEKQR